MTDSNKPPKWYWITAVLALLWNLAGVANYMRNVTMTEEMLATYSEAEQALMTDVPTLIIAAFAIAVWGGVLGCVFLLLKKAWAYPVLIVSFLAILIQMFYNLFMSNMLEVYGAAGVAVPLTTIPIGFFLVWLARKAKSSGWVS